MTTDKKIEIFKLIGKAIILLTFIYISYLIFSAYFDIPGLDPYTDQVEESI